MHLGALLAYERDKRGISQRQVGDLLDISQVTVSRWESDPEISHADAIRYLDAIESDFAETVKMFDGSTWDKFTAIPELNHPDLPSLVSAHMGLQTIEKLVDQVPETHFIQDELSLYRDALKSAAEYLLALDHTVAFIGSIGVGKTTALCSATDLLLEGKPVLDYGGGRTTICEVVINQGPGWGMTVEPMEYDDVVVLVDDFCDYIHARIANEAINRGKASSADTEEVNVLSTELTRCIRNMAGLSQKRDSKTRQVTDDAIELGKVLNTKEKLKLEILARMNLRSRNDREVWYSHNKDKDPLQWLKKSFTRINHGRNPDFSIPKRINVLVPHTVLNQGDTIRSAPWDISIIDTKGIDQFAPRADLSMLFDDPRALCIICSRFLDAPDETSRSVLKHAIESGLRSRIQLEAELLVLDRQEEAESVNDFDGTQVSSSEDGRQVRLADIEDSLYQEPLKLDALPASFFNQREDSATDLSNFIAGGIRKMREVQADKIRRVTAQLEQLSSELETYKESACYRNIGESIQAWIKNNQTPDFILEQVKEALPESIVDKSTYAASVRASVNRRGSWYNLNYYYQLAFGTRVDFVTSISPAIKQLTSLLENFSQRDDMKPAHSFIRELIDYVLTSSGNLQEQAQQMGEAVFEEPLRESASLWTESQARWGQGTGYKGDISLYASQWLESTQQLPLYEKLEESMNQKWIDFMQGLSDRTRRALES